MSTIGLNTPRLAGGTFCYLAEVASAIFLILGYSFGAFHRRYRNHRFIRFPHFGSIATMIGVFEDRANE